MNAASTKRTDAGFLTAVFGVSAIALATIAIACLQLARSDVVASRRNWERLQDRYAAEGLVNLAAWRLLHMDETTAVQWREPLTRSTAEVFAEPEARKLSLAEVSGGRGLQRLSDVIGDEAARRIGPKLVALSQGREPPARGAIVEVDDDARWRRCGLTLVSTHSRLTDNALATPGPARVTSYRPRDGEVWRIVVVRGQTVQIDQLLRFTGDLDQPAATIDELAASASPAGCLDQLHKSRGGAHETD